jgi:hypothetical protein
MSATTIVTIPREPGQLVVDEVTVAKIVIDRLRELFGLVFPTEENRDAMHRHSEPLFTVPLDARAREVLKDNGYSFTHLSQATLRVVRGQKTKRKPLWDLDLISRKEGHEFEFRVAYFMPQQDRMEWFEGWKPTTPEDAITLSLETRPWVMGGYDTSAKDLALLFHEAGWNVPQFVMALCGVGGSMEISWEELGIESSVSMEKFFRDFVDSFGNGEENLLGGFVHFLALHPEHSPLDPAPFKHYRSSLDHKASLLNSPVRIPESCRESLRARWLEQLYTFGETRLPRRP